MLKLSNLNLETKIKDLLERAGLLTSNDILRCNEYVLHENTNLSLEQCRELLNQVSQSILPFGFVSARSLASEPRLTTGCAILDTALRGGVSSRGIVEICGESGCGKTQLCLQLSLTAQWPITSSGLQAGVLYVCTEDVFPSKRLQQLIKAFPCPAGSGSSWNYGDNIYVEHIADADSLKMCLLQRAPPLMTHRRLRLVIIDSIAGVFRTHTEGGMIKRALELRAVAKQLTQLAVNHDALIICVNQVAEVPGVAGEGSREVPALGLSWANLTNTKLRLSRGQQGARYIESLSSPDLPSGIKWSFQITANGLFGT